MFSNPRFPGAQHGGISTSELSPGPHRGSGDGLWAPSAKLEPGEVASEQIAGWLLFCVPITCEPCLSQDARPRVDSVTWL